MKIIKFLVICILAVWFLTTCVPALLIGVGSVVAAKAIIEQSNER